MTVVERHIRARPEQVWEVLADGWLYPAWVVGASRMRAVDAAWPDAGTRLHHSVGGWPLLLDDSTEVEVSEPGHRLVLSAHGWPFGTARVDLTLTPEDGGTLVRIAEDAVRGPGTLVPGPLRRPPIAWRNTETLRRLAYLSERRQ